ncbi:MAG: acyltransferase domain-containing protein [Gordonia sp. (in: high G+C Gram-positive bacteria)]
MTLPRDEAEVRGWLTDYLVRIGCDPGDVDVNAAFNDLGLGSRDSVVLAGELSEFVGRTVSPVDLWEHPTVSTLTSFLVDADAPPSPSDAEVSVERAHDDAIAVIGLGCRFPGGVHGPDEYWDFLLRSGSGVSQVPEGRWSQFDDGRSETAAALRRTTRWGGYLADVDAFDSEYFDISPSEADKMDPQQRLLLEVVQEALDHAGIPAAALRHSQTGVFTGSCAGEYGFLATSDLAQVDAWSGTGGALSIISNRLSYHYDLRGPSVTIDTACSSSLVAIHLACASLRSGESSLALAAGVNVLLSPAITRSFDSADAMSQTGQCHSFDAAADGYVRGEGAGVVVLKRLSEAIRDGNRILAVVRGSAVNQDGRSNGLMAPNPSAQMGVLRTAYAAAGLTPRDVDYVEAHGTGTLLGDPIEARALGSVLGRGRGADDPLLIGAVKSNIGHLEAAAGVAGFIKAVLALDRGLIPANLGYSQPNPHINFDQLRLRVVAQHVSWPQRDRVNRAGVSAFGFGGTNAHVVLEQAPVQASAVSAGAEAPAVTTLTVTGRSADRVRSAARSLADWLATDGADVALADVAYTLDHHRTRHPAFATVVATDTTDAVTGLRALAEGEQATGVVGVHEGKCRPGTVFVYSGQGSQWAGMAQTLLADEPEFATALADIEPDFVAAAGFSLIDVIRSGEQVTGIERIQPVLTGLQLALTRLWRSYGIVPDAVIGHSMGETAAAVVAGALSVADGLKVIATRSRLMSALSGQGAMALVELDTDGAAALIQTYPDVTIAVHASPRQTVIAGPPEQIDAAVAQVASRDLLARRVEVDVASHHPIIDPVLPALRAELADLSPRRPIIPLLTTTLASGEPTFDADYWCANLRNPVRFSEAVAAAGAEHGVFVEVSPHPVLTYAIDDTLAGVHHHSIPTLQRHQHDTVTFHTHLNAARTDTPPVTAHRPTSNQTGSNQTGSHRAVLHPALPVTVWHRSKHWISLPERETAAGLAPAAGTLLGEYIDVAGNGGTRLWRARLTPEAKPYPGSHALNGLEVVPVSVLIGTLTRAARDAGIERLGDVSFDYPVAVDGPRTIHVVAEGDTLSISSRTGRDTGRWVRHATARSASSPVSAPAALGDDTGLIADGENRSTAEILREWGVHGRPFDWTLSALHRSPSRLVAEVTVANPSPEAVLDAAAHVARLVDDSRRDLMVPSKLSSAWLTDAVSDTVAPHTVVTVDIRRVPTDDGSLVVDVYASSPAGLIADIRGLHFTPLNTGVEHTPDADPSTIARRLEWQPDPVVVPVQTVVDGKISVRGDEVTARALADALRTAGADATADAGGAADGDGAADLRAGLTPHVIYVGAVAGSDHAAHAARMSTDVTTLVTELASRGAGQTLWILTRGVRVPESSDALAQSALWGLAQVIAEEQPDLWGGLIDLPPDVEFTDVAGILATRLSTPIRTTCALENGQFLVPVAVPIDGEPVREELRCRPDAAYLVTGGFGALGLVIAQWLADRGARRIILAGRTGLPPRRAWDDPGVDASVATAIAGVRALESRGVAVEPVRLDIASAEALRALLARRDDDGAPAVRGVVHAAGVTENRLLTETDTNALEKVMQPKIAGAQALAEAFAPGELDFLHFTASAGALYGIAGQGGYAAANAYLDALARFDNPRTDRRTLSIDWVAWQDLGFATQAALVVDELARRGSRPVRPVEALRAWEYIDRYDIAQAVVLPPIDGDVASTDTDNAVIPAWSQLSREEMLDTLESGLRGILAHELRVSEAQLESDIPFAELGLNSVMAMSIRRDAEKLTGLELSATMLWNHPTIGALAAHLADKIAPEDDSDELLAEESEGLLDSLFDDVESSSLGAEGF